MYTFASATCVQMMHAIQTKGHALKHQPASVPVPITLIDQISGHQRNEICAIAYAMPVQLAARNAN